jgi:hypothetical protein
MMAEPWQEGKRTREKERVSSRVLAISTAELDGHDGSDGVRQNFRGSSFSRKRESMNRLGGETKEWNRN